MKILMVIFGLRVKIILAFHQLKIEQLKKQVIGKAFLNISKLGVKWL